MLKIWRISTFCLWVSGPPGLRVSGSGAPATVPGREVGGGASAVEWRWLRAGGGDRWGRGKARARARAKHRTHQH